MKKLFLLTFALVATVMLFASPIVAEASDPLGSVTIEKTYASSYAVLDTEIGTDLGHSAESIIEQVAIEATVEWPTWSPGMRTIYAEEAFAYFMEYTTPLSTGSDKVPI